jgi:hypothetical protein
MVPKQRRPPDRPLRDRLGAQGLCPSSTLVHTLWQRDPAEPDSTIASAGARGLPRALGSRSTTSPRPALGSCLTNNTSQGPGSRREASGYRCPGPPWHRPLGVPLPTAPPIGSRSGRDTRRQSFPTTSKGSGAFGPTCQPLEPTSFTTKKTLECLTWGG